MHKSCQTRVEGRSGFRVLHCTIKALFARDAPNAKAKSDAPQRRAGRVYLHALTHFPLALNRLQGDMRFCGKLNADHIIGAHDAADAYNAHHTGFANKTAIGIVLDNGLH